MFRLFYGQDTYSLNHELKEIEKSFANENFGEINISKFEGESLTADQLIRSASALPFLAEKRLIIITNFLRDGDEKLRQYLSENLDKFPSSSEVILVEEGEVNKNLGIFKRLTRLGGVKNFPLHQGWQLENWLVNWARGEKVPISTSGIKKLIATAGNNSWRLTNEMKKLDLYRRAQGKREIESEDIERMVESEHDPNIFDFIDALGTRNAKSAAGHLQELFKSGKNENYILTMIVWAFRNMLIVSDLVSRGVKGPALAAEADLHPFVANKTLRSLSNYDLPLLKRIYHRLMQTDIDIKTGRVEPRLALERLLVDLTV